MKHLLVIACLLSMGLAACTPGSMVSTPPTSPAAQATDVPPVATPTHIPVDLTPAQRAAIASVVKSLGLTADQVRFVSSEAVTWPNGCMGVQRLGVMCTQNQVPGFRIIVSANGKQYEVHTNQDGSVVVPEQALEVPGPAQKAAVTQLAHNLGIPESQVKLVSTAVIEWPDSCLGVAQQGVMCSQIVTPGFLFVLEANGRQYEYHTNQDASQIMPGSTALIWQEQGGIAGVCKNLTAYLSGEVYGQNCGPNGDGRMALLTADQRAKLEAWMDKLADTSIDLSSPKGVSDQMTRTAQLLGTGQAKASADEQQQIFDFAQSLYQQMFP